MKIKPICRSALFTIILAVCFAHASAQTDQQKLTATILHLDSAFWNAYNNCDTAHFKDFFTDDVEFYHDKGGVTSGATAFIQSLDKNLCGKASYHLRREAVTGSVKVYPMEHNDEIYGAIITGDHVFYITENSKPEFLDGAASFTHLWLLKNGVWKMARILSYNHHTAEYINKRKEIELTAQQLDQLAGTYKSAQSGIATITAENKILILKVDNNTYMLYPQTVDSFFTKDRDLIFEFVKDAAGKPVKVVVKEHGTVADELIFEK